MSDRCRPCPTGQEGPGLGLVPEIGHVSEGVLEVVGAIVVVPVFHDAANVRPASHTDTDGQPQARVDTAGAVSQVTGIYLVDPGSDLRRDVSGRDLCRNAERDGRHKDYDQRPRAFHSDFLSTVDGGSHAPIAGTTVLGADSVTHRPTRLTDLHHAQYDQRSTFGSGSARKPTTS